MIDSDRIAYLSERRKNFFQKLLIACFAVVQSITLTIRFKSMIYLDYLSTIVSFLIIILILLTGAMFLAWLADMNTMKGIGGHSIFIIPGLISNLPAMLLTGREREFDITLGVFVILMIVTLLFIYFTLYLYKAEYRIYIERTGIDNKLSHSYVPIKLLTAGAMPYMFAITVFSLPQLILLNPAITNTFISQFLTVFFSFNTIEGIITYGIVIFSLGVGFRFINVLPYDIAKSMKYSGDYIVNVVPGMRTQQYITKKLKLVASIGNAYLVVISVILLFVDYISQLFLT